MTSTQKIKIIAGSGRSGTTWVQDVMAEANNARPLFEPLHPAHMPTEALAYRTLGKDDEAKDMHRFFHKILDPDFRDYWCDYRVNERSVKLSFENLNSKSSIHRLLRRRKDLKTNRLRFGPLLDQQTTVMKIIRGNLMLPWLKQNLGADIALLVRHPCAVYHSRLGGTSWDAFKLLEQYKSDILLGEMYLDEHRDYLNSGLSQSQAQVAVWCIENVVPIQKAGNEGYGVVHYEHLVECPDDSWQKVATFLNLPNIPETETTKRPSQMASSLWAETPITKGNYQRWVGDIPREELSLIGETLDQMGGGIYSADDPLPISRPFDV